MRERRLKSKTKQKELARSFKQRSSTAQGVLPKRCMWPGLHSISLFTVPACLELKKRLFLCCNTVDPA